jgi:hypothetical protein
MTLRAAWTALGVRRSVPANQPLDDRFFRQLSTDPDSPRERQHCRVGGSPPPTATVHPEDHTHQRFEDAPRPIQSDSPVSDKITRLSI